MKIISTEWKTFFVEEKNFLLKTDKAYFIQLPNKAGALEGLWISTKFAKYNHISKKGKWYIVRGYWLCKNTCYKYKQLSGEIW